MDKKVKGISIPTGAGTVIRTKWVRFSSIYWLVPLYALLGFGNGVLHTRATFPNHSPKRNDLKLLSNECPALTRLKVLFH